MIVLRVLLFAAGLALVLLMIRSMVRTFLVPRALQAHLSRAVFVLVRRVFRLRASERHDYAMRDRVMALYAPVSLLILLAVWFSFLLLGYSAMFFALGEVSPSEAFTLAGSSMLTLGFAHPPTDAGVFLTDEVPMGEQVVRLTLPANCRADNGAERTVTFSPQRRTAVLRFEVRCS